MHFALVKHDAAIIRAAVRQLTKRTADVLTVLIGLPVLAILARAWLTGLPGELRQLVAYGASALIATIVAKTCLERVWFHQTEGVLARFAQRPGDWLCYIVPVLVAAILAGILGMVAIGILDPIGTALGTSAGVAGGLAMPLVAERLRRWWRDVVPKRGFNLLRHRHALTISAAASAGIGAIAAWLPEDGHFGAILAGTYGLVVILLTGRVDAGTVRYMTLVGHSSTSMLRHWLLIQLALLCPMASVLLLAQNAIAGGVAVVLGLGLPVVTALRIFAYRALSRLIADWMVAGIVAATGYAALTLPVLGPVVMIAAMIGLVRQGSGSRWLLA